MTLPVHPPTPLTLAKFGLTHEAWQRLLDQQDGSCALCGEVPSCTRKACKVDWPHGHLVIDHEHVRGWKRMPVVQRRHYVRGLLCPWDNRFVLGRYITIAKAERIYLYLRRYQMRNMED